MGGSIGFNWSQSRESGTGVADPEGIDSPEEAAFSSSVHSSFVATKAMNAEIRGGIIEEKPVDAHYTKRSYGVNAGVNVSQGAKPSGNYGGHYSRTAYRGRTMQDGTTEDIFSSQAGISADNRTIETLVSPMETLKEIKRDGVALGRMGAGIVNTFKERGKKERDKKDAKEKHKITVKQTWQTMGQALVNVEEQYNNSKNESVVEVTEDPSSVNRDKLAKVTHGILQQNTDNPATGIDFYRSTDEKDFEKHGTGKENPANHNGNYNTTTGRVGINVGAGRTRLDDGGGELARTTYVEKGRRRQDKEGVDSKATEQQRTNQVYFLGEEAKKNHEAFRSVNGRGAPKRSHDAWLHDNKKPLDAGNRRMRATKKKDLKPFMAAERFIRGRQEIRALKNLEKTPEYQTLEKEIKEAEEAGNTEEANSLKARKQLMELAAMRKANGLDDLSIPRSLIPILGSSEAAIEAWKEGNKVSAAVHAVMAGADIFIVTSFLRKAGVTIGTKALSGLVQQAEKRVMRAGAEQVAHEGVKQLEKQALKKLEEQVVKQVVGEGGNVVYHAVENGVTKYVGITNNFARRQAEHLAAKGLRIKPLMEGLSRTDARAVEQALIEINKLGKNGGSLLNKINSIAKNNPKYGQQLERGYGLLKSIGYN